VDGPTHYQPPDFARNKYEDDLRRRNRLFLILPDGRDGLTQIDHLALMSNGLLVVETKNSGVVPASVRDRLTVG